VIPVTCLIGVLVASPIVVYTVRERQFIATQQFVQELGGSLQFDLVDGNYMVDLNGDAATDETIQKLVPKLKELPTGFTRIGPGEERSFWISLGGSSISDAGIGELCELPIEGLNLNGVSITDAGARRLSQEPTIYAIILNDVRLSDSTLAQLRVSKPNATVVVIGDSE
jgi:hypothetical protein